MSQCQNVCGNTVPDGYRLCPACQACANQRVQTVRAKLEANCDRLRAEKERLRSENMKFHMYGDFRKLDVFNELTDMRAENERLRSIYADASEALLYITAYVRGEIMQEPYPEPGQYAEFDTVRAVVDGLRLELQAANLTIEARDARLAEARIEIVGLRAEKNEYQSVLEKFDRHWGCNHIDKGTPQELVRHAKEDEVEIDRLRNQLVDSSLTIEARDARLTEARAELADLRAVEEAVGTTISPTWMAPCLQKAVYNYQSRWQSGEKEEPPRSTQLSQTKHKTHMTAELTGTYEPAE